MAVIPFREWTPDSSDFGNPGSPVIRNALPGVNSYGPLNSLQTTSSALSAYPRGAIQASDENENEFAYAGDASALYELTGSTWGDISKGGGYSSGNDERWRFLRWKEKVLATNFSDSPQQITFGGTAFSDLTTALRFRHFAVVRDFIVAGYTFDGTDGTVRDRVRWSAQGDESDWTPSVTTLSDFRDLGIGGGIQSVVGGEFGVIVSEDSTFRLTFVGAPLIFQIDEVLPGVGSIAPGGVIKLGDAVFYPSEHGFVALRGGASETFIGSGKVDQFFLNDIDRDYAYRMTAVSDPQSQLIFWAYPGSGNTNGTPNKLICYNRAYNRWGYAEVETELLWRSGGTSQTLESLDDLDLGPELVSNGDFATDTIWTKGTGWTISGSATHAAGTASDLTQTLVLSDETYYRVEFDVSGRTAGSLTPTLGGTAGTAISADATDIKESIRTATGDDLAFSATSDFDGSVDNVSVKRVNDLDSMAISLDSQEFKGSSPLLSAFDATNSSGNFIGTPYTAVFVTKEMELNEGRRTRLTGFVPLIEASDAANLSARVGSRSRQSDPVQFTTTESLRDTGRFAPRVNDKYMRFEVTVAGDWANAVGIVVDSQDARRAERRG